MSFTETVFLTTFIAPIVAFVLYLLDRSKGQNVYRWLVNCGRSPEEQLTENLDKGFIYNQKSSAWLLFLSSGWSLFATSFYWCCGTSRFMLVVFFLDCLVTTVTVFYFSEVIYPKWDKFCSLFRRADRFKEKFEKGEVLTPNFWGKISPWLTWASGLWPSSQGVKPVVVMPPVETVPKAEEPKVDHRGEFEKRMKKMRGE